MLKTPKSEDEGEFSGSLMDDIQQLIKGPEYEQKPLNKVSARHPYYKRPGRGHNHDYCDACEEGGDLICCDRCPSSFHLQCHDPPLMEDDIPAGQWLCHNCRMVASKRGSVERLLGIKIDSDKSRSTTPLSELESLSAVPLTVRNLRKRSSSHISVSSDTSEKPVYTKISPAIAKALDPNRKPTSFDELINFAILLNPKQFSLPPELEVHFNFPGSDRSKYGARYLQNGGKKPNRNNNRFKPYELDSQGLVPLPVKTCFSCGKSCRKAPLVACDYCPLLFHQDCLNPPLTSLPTSRWMCPNHVEHFIDSKLVKTISATERIKLWTKFTTPVDHESIKTDFLRRVHKANPPFRIKVPQEQQPRAEVPATVEYHYKYPPPLLPSLREVYRYNRYVRPDTEEDVISSSQPSQEDMLKQVDEDLRDIRIANKKYKTLRREYGHESDCSTSTEEEVSPVLKRIKDSTDNINVENLSISNEQSSKDIEMKTVDTELTVFETSTSTTITALEGTNTSNTSSATNNTMLDESKSNISRNIEYKVSSSVVASECQGSKEYEGERKTVSPQSNYTFEGKGDGEGDVDTDVDDDGGSVSVIGQSTAGEEVDDDDDEYALNFKIDRELRYLDVSVIKSLAYQRLEQIIAENPDIVAKYKNRTAARTIRNICRKKADKNLALPSQLLTKEDIRRIAKDFTDGDDIDSYDEDDGDGEDLYNDRDNNYQLDFNANSDIETTQLTRRAKSEQDKAREIAARLECQIIESSIRARAVLTSVGDVLDGKRWFTDYSLEDSVCMRYRSFEIGYGRSVDLDLTKFGHCRQISPRHASIFYDSVTNYFELINYSEFGTEVNGQIYGCDFTEHSYPPLKQYKDDSKELQNKLREILDKRRNIKRINLEFDKNAKMAAPSHPPCKCAKSMPLIAGWEGSAIITHGTLLRFGCLAFVFSTVDFNQ